MKQFVFGVVAFACSVVCIPTFYATGNNEKQQSEELSIWKAGTAYGVVTNHTTETMKLKKFSQALCPNEFTMWNSKNSPIEILEIKPGEIKEFTWLICNSSYPTWSRLYSEKTGTEYSKVEVNDFQLANGARYEFAITDNIDDVPWFKYRMDKIDKAKQ